MELWEIPRGSKIYEECSDGSKYIEFGHTDGMYSYSLTEKGAVVHLSRFTPLERFEDGYQISK